MAAVYARFKERGNWRYQKVGKGRPPRDASFHVRFTDAQGKRRWSQPFKSVEDANANSEGVKIASIAASKGLTVEEYKDVLNAGKTTVKDAVEEFLKLHRNDRPKTIQQYTTTLNHLAANTDAKFVRDLATTDTLNDYIEILKRDGYAKKTINTRLGVIFSLLKGYENETGVKYASKLVSVPKPVPSRPKAYSTEELVQLFGAMSEEERERYLFFLHTGCREQEVQFASWDDVDFKQRKFHVTGNGKEDVNFVPKNHEERWIPLTTELYDVLKERRKTAKHRWVFSNEEGKPEGHFLRKFKAIAKKAGMNCGLCRTTIMDGKYHLRKPTEVTCETRPVCEKHYLHRLRKTAATRWLRNGINLMDIKTWLGHASLAVTQIYLEDSMDIDQTMQAKLDRAAKV
jgi:integrase